MHTRQRYRKSNSVPPFLIALLLLAFFVMMMKFWNANITLRSSKIDYNVQRNKLEGEEEEEEQPPPLAPLTEKQMDEESVRLKEALNARFLKMVKGVSAADEGGKKNWCARMAEGTLGVEERKRLEQWTFVEPKNGILEEFGGGGGKKKEEGKQRQKRRSLSPMKEKCQRFQEAFLFHEKPLSEEERQFPLAYGLLVYKSTFQVYTLMSAIYQPQNAYCITVDEKSSKEFKNTMNLLSDCFPNIFVMQAVGSIEWCKFGITRAVFTCLSHLTKLEHKWRYYQYLSGFDLPLKTNLEMVRILKQLHGTVNMEVSLYQPFRLNEEVRNIEPPLKLWKSSMSALVPREAANAMIASEKVQELMLYLQHTECSDESIWASIFGNPKELSVPGGFDAATFFAERKACVKNKEGGNFTEIVDQEVGQLAKAHPNEPFLPDNYYVARYQVWGDATLFKCNGKFVSSSCVYGIGDVPVLLKRPELSQHKMYLSYQPAAYFCLWKSVHERALDWRAQKDFKATAYSELPTVKSAIRGEGKEERFYDEKCLMSIW